MKTLSLHTSLLALLIAGSQLHIRAQETPNAPNPPAATAQEKPTATSQATPPATPTILPAPPSQATAPDSTEAPPANEIRMNFRGVPLDMVLDYMSKAAGFTILLETKVEGKVDVWSHRALTQEEAIDLLNTVLNKNGYAAIRNGRTLTIVSRDEARKRQIPVRKGAEPEKIPKNDEMVTQIVPVLHANAIQLVKDLQPLIPAYATLTANESSNAIVITDTQSNIHRLVQIVQALDTSISSISNIRVYPLKYADAKELATVISSLFESQANRQANNARQQFAARMRGGGDPRAAMIAGMLGGGGPGGQTETGVSAARDAASRVVATADERTNSLVVGAPEEYLPTIDQVVSEIDVAVDDVTELRVFPLTYSDPVEMSELLAELFPDPTTSNQGNRGGGFGQGMPQFFGGGGRGGTQANQSERKRNMSKVVAVPDSRTAAVIVMAASELMPQIAQMIQKLDSNPAKKQKVFVYSLDHAEPNGVANILRDMFETQLNSRNQRNNQQQQNNLLENRNRQQLGTGTTGGFGGQGGTGGQRLGGTGR